MEGTDAAVERILGATELWAVPGDESPLLVAGWEDAHRGCVRSGRTDADAAACRACPIAVVRQAAADGRPRHDRCPAGIGLLAIPVPARTRDRVAVIRCDPGPPPGPVLLAAARRLRNPAGLARWEAGQRERGAERRRTAAAALAQMIATSEEFHRLYQEADEARRAGDRDAAWAEGLARDTIRVAAEERAAVAHELHDTAAQSMVSAYRFLEAARASVQAPGREAAADGHLVEASERLLAAIREVRTVLARLVPPGLEELGLANAVGIHLRDRVAPSGITTRVDGDLPRMEPWREAGCFSIVAEAVALLVDAGARSVGIDLRAQRARGIITLTGDVAPEALRATTHPDAPAWSTLERRTGWLGGRLDLEEAPPTGAAGTRVVVSVPIEGRASGRQPGDRPKRART